MSDQPTDHRCCAHCQPGDIPGVHCQDDDHHTHAPIVGMTGTHWPPQQRYTAALSTDQPTDHADAERWLTDAEAVKTAAPDKDNVLDAITAGLDVIGSALIGIGHALLAGPPEKVTPKQAGQAHAEYLSRHSPMTVDEDKDLCGFAQGTNRCVRTDGHTGIHHLARDHT